MEKMSVSKTLEELDNHVQKMGVAAGNIQQGVSCSTNIFYLEKIGVQKLYADLNEDYQQFATKLQKLQSAIANDGAEL
jgi:hypothetical protein